MGSWVLYGLGSEAENLPGFVVLVSAGKGGQMQPIAARQWSAGILPSRFQGVQFNSVGDPVLHVQSPPGLNAKVERDVVDAINALNGMRTHRAVERSGNPDAHRAIRDGVQDAIERARPGGHEQGTAAGARDVRREARRRIVRVELPARARLAERGVRFIQLYHRDWDHHGGVKDNVAIKAQETDQATAALITDLKQRGMLDDTLVVWGGEFGRTPMSQGGDGRDHHIKGFSFLIAGGGIKGGISYGSTDDFGYAAQENPVAVPDFHATMLHLLGIDHKRLSVKFQGLDARLTGIAGGVVKKHIPWMTN